MHPDHVLGNAAFEGEVTFVGHEKLPRALAERGQFYLDKAVQMLGADSMAGTKVIPPSLTIKDEMELDLGNRFLRLQAWPTAHTDNDVTVLDTKTGTLFAGDLLFVHHIPALDGSVKGWLAVIGRLKAIDAARAVPGHGPPSVPWPDALTSEEAYLQRLRDAVRADIAEGKTIGEAAKASIADEGANWALFDEYNARNISAAYAELEWE
jgi:quinoprotein relay system zinc metallohydrolase 2